MTVLADPNIQAETHFETSSSGQVRAVVEVTNSNAQVAENVDALVTVLDGDGFIIEEQVKSYQSIAPNSTVRFSSEPFTPSKGSSYSSQVHVHSWFPDTRKL